MNQSSIALATIRMVPKPAAHPIWLGDTPLQPSRRRALPTLHTEAAATPARGRSGPIEGSGVPGTNPKEPPLKAGEFILGYADEMGFTPPPPKPEVLGRNGTYAVVRKLRQRVS